MKIVADDKIPFLKGVFEPFADIEYIDGNKIIKADLVNADALIIRSVTSCNSELLEGTSIKFIATATIGDDHIDKKFCKKNDIRWVSAKGCNAKAVVQYVTVALLSIAEKRNLDLKQMVIGIIGVGDIGSKIKKMAEIIGMQVLLNDPPRAEREKNNDFVDLDTLLRSSDIISLHVPLLANCTHPTKHMADNRFFAKVKKPVVFINTSRGQVVNETVLKRSIINESVSQTIIDVWDNEPEVDISLIELVDICTPHIAGYSIEGKATATSMVVKEINDFFGFGLKAWYPFLDEHKNRIDIDCKGLSFQNVLHKVVSQTYNIWEDDKMLRSFPEDFQNQRNNYSFRREFGAYTLKPINCEKGIEEKLLKLGFNIP